MVLPLRPMRTDIGPTWPEPLVPTRSDSVESAAWNFPTSLPMVTEKWRNHRWRSATGQEHSRRKAGKICKSEPPRDFATENRPVPIPMRIISGRSAAAPQLRRAVRRASIAGKQDGLPGTRRPLLANVIRRPAAWPVTWCSAGVIQGRRENVRRGYRPPEPRRLPRRPPRSLPPPRRPPRSLSPPPRRES